MDPAAHRETAQTRPVRLRLSLSSLLLMAIWLGLAVGYLDLAVIFAKKWFLNQEGAYRTAKDFLWTVPVGHVVLSLIAALILAAIHWFWPRRVSLRTGSWLLATLAIWSALMRMPIHMASALFLACVVGLLFSDAVVSSGFHTKNGWVSSVVLQKS